MIKTYEIHNTVSAVYIFTLGKAKPFKAEFKGGRLDLEKPVPATFSTPHLGQQLAIENSSLFNNVVFLKGGNSSKENKNAPVPKEMVVVPEVTTFGEAVNYLKSKGAKATQMKTPEAMLAMADRKGISFPNLKTEE